LFLFIDPGQPGNGRSGDMSGKAVILLVEDQRGFRRIYEDVLSNEGYDVLTAEDGEIGWALAREKKPDLILLDLGLPKLNGFEVLQNIRADEATRKIPVIIFSVVGEQADIDRALAMGADEYTVKGFHTPRQVLERMEGLLARRKPESLTRKV
jgi:DNA-binding response OmpR family regulator